MMSYSQEEILSFNSPEKTLNAKKNRRRNRITSPENLSPVHTSHKKDVFELFTVKTPSKPKPKILQSDSQETSELSDDVFIKPKPVSLSTPSKSDTKSYRDKVNERFKTVKDKAGKSSKKASVFKEAAEKILLERIKRESNDIDAELESIRNRLKLDKTPENREKYDFFCSDKCEERIEEENEEFRSTGDLTANKTDIEYVLPKQNRGVLRSSEEALFFKARARPVDLVDKIEPEEPRFLEDEGYYAPPAPKISTQNLNLLEQRLSRDHKKWFNCDGTLNFLENPCQNTSCRPHFKHLPTKEVAMYLPARIEDTECEEIVVVRENLLQLQISSLVFTHHPLFSREHVLAEKLKTLYREYEESMSKNDLIRLTRRLEGLRRVLKHWEETSSQSGDQSDREEEKIEAYRRDIRTLQEQVFDEGKKERDRMKTILHTWKAIKKIREENKYSTTSIKLVIRKENVNSEEEKENFEKHLEEIYDEYVDYNRGKSRRKRQNEDNIKEELLERFRESFRAPGEPLLHFLLTSENTVTKNVDNAKETSRRGAVLATKIALKIVCNKMEVCKTKWVNLQDDFVCNFDETVSIQLISVPKSVTVEIIEQPKSLIKRTVGELTLNVPPRNQGKEGQKRVTFEKPEIVHYKHEGVGSGITIDDLGSEELNTSGSLRYALDWDSPVKFDETTPEENKILGEIIDKYGVIDSEKLSQWMQQRKPDPQDPRNSILYEYSLDCSENLLSPQKDKKYFRLNHQMEKWQFCDPKILEDNLRLKILQLRNRNEPEFDKMVVPNRIKEIPLDVLADYKRRTASERQALVVEDDDEENEIERKRSKGRKYLKQIHIKVFQKCKNSDNNLTFEDVVDEKLLPHFEKFFKSMVSGIIKWFQWRPLKPPLVQIKTKQESKNDHDLQSQVKVVITVISGLNIPVRMEDRKDKVQPFVEVDYNGTTVRSLTNEGPHPIWNEKLILPLEPSHLDYLNPNSLNGAITINLFDEDDKILTKFSGQKRKYWLGSVDVPLSAICSGIQGMFKVKKPYLLLGYKGEENEQRKGAKNAQTNQHTYLNLHIIIEPSIPKLNPAIEELPSAEIPYISDHAINWNEEYNMNFPNRKISVFAIDANGSTTCITRYIKALEPPQINVEGFDVTPEQCARFVSLIPYSDCNQFYKNIWLSVDKLLHFIIGSIIDHAVTLTCYLLALKMEAWLLLGLGIPHGYTAFVLVKEYDNNQVPNFYLYDVVSGEKIIFSDAFCPVQKVYCVVNEHNVWANIQRNDDLTTMRFDFTRRFDWLPLFTNKIPAPTNSIQNTVTYLPKPSTEELEITLDRKIRKRIAKMRQLDRTVWNHHVSNVFKGILSHFEKSEMYGKSNSDAVEQIRELTAAYKLRGHIFHSSFSDVTSIVKRVKSYGLYLEEDDNAQFASAVYIKPYPNQVLAVWLFLAVVQEVKDNHLDNEE